MSVWVPITINGTAAARIIAPRKNHSRERCRVLSMLETTMDASPFIIGVRPINRSTPGMLKEARNDRRNGSRSACWRLYSWNVSDTNPIPSFLRSSLIPNSWGEVGVSISKLNYPRLEGEGFKWGRFEIDHRPRGQ